MKSLRISAYQQGLAQQNAAAQQNYANMLANAGSANIQDLLNMQAGSLVRYTGKAPPVAAMPSPLWDTVLEGKRARQAAELEAHKAAQMVQIASVRALNDALYTGGIDPEDRLIAWHKRLASRVAELEADDATMGKTETAKWAKELEEFRAEFC